MTLKLYVSGWVEEYASDRHTRRGRLWKMAVPCRKAEIRPGYN
ncbi:MAG: hypothetical protein OXU68_02580 [Bacteroidota bacterium]|nr:hypothetical protein [Bacteroidota bacterium]